MSVARVMLARKFTSMLAVLFILAASMLATSGVEAQRLNGAGVVIRHGDGTLIYAYVQFDEESISGMDLLQRAGLPLSVAPFAGLGTGICSIGGEGCPADDCYCHSYQAPATWWHYYTYDGGWAISPAGPSSRTIQDGAIDGWSWTAGDSGLPTVSIDEIAAMNGVDRNPPTPTPVPPTETPVPTDTPPPPPTSTPEPEPSATPIPPTATATATVTPIPAATSTATTPPTATSSPSPSTTPLPSTTPTATTSATAIAQVASPTATRTATEAPATATRQPTSVAVIVTPGETPQPLDIQDDSDDGSSNLVLFGVFAVLIAAAGGGALLYQRRRGP